jgi:hypothetical protein
MRNIVLLQHSPAIHLVFSHFQLRRFLAHYRAMCPSNDPVVNPEPKSTPLPDTVLDEQQTKRPLPVAQLSAEVGGREGLEPTRYGDWEKAGRCIDF